MLPRLFIAHTAKTVAEALDAADVDGAVAVVGNPRLCRAVADAGHTTVAVDERVRGLRRATGPRVAADPYRLPFRDRAFAALVSAAPAGDDWAARFAEWARVVSESGALVIVDRLAPTELSRRALCFGLLEIEQRSAGRDVVTSGLVPKL